MVLRHILFWHYLDYHFSIIWIDEIRFTDSQVLEGSTYSMIYTIYFILFFHKFGKQTVD